MMVIWVNDTLKVECHVDTKSDDRSALCVNDQSDIPSAHEVDGNSDGSDDSLCSDNWKGHTRLSFL